MRGPPTGAFQMPVWTVLPCQITSRGKPTLTESKRPIAFPNGELPQFAFSVYEALAAAAGLPFCVTAAISAFAAGPEECGFCPVISRPSRTT